VLALTLPRIAFPLIWIGFFFVFDPLNRLLGNKSLSEKVAHRRWDTVLVLFAAGLICGYCWELWNWGALPKWVYHIPYANRPTLFEMPLLGYGGYLPFALEVYAAYDLLHWLVFRRRDTVLTFDVSPREPRASSAWWAVLGSTPGFSGSSGRFVRNSDQGRQVDAATPN
jgi:hypothetical protein